MRVRWPPRSRRRTPRKKPAAALPIFWSPGSPRGCRQFIASFDGSPHIEELFSEHLIQARDLYQKYAGLYAAHGAATIERVCRKQRLALADGMTPQKLAQCVEMAINGAKSAHPGMQPADAFVGDSHHHGADAGRRRRHPVAEAAIGKARREEALAEKSPSRKSPARQKSGGRK